MRVSLALTALLFVLGGCAPLAQPPSPPLPPPNAVDRAEGEFLIAERIWDRPERELSVGEQAKITLRVTAKENLEYIYWREVLHIGIAYMEKDDITTQSDLEFMVLRVPKGGTVEWTYTIAGRRAGQDAIEGQIKSVVGRRDESLYMKANVIVR